MLDRVLNHKNRFGLRVVSVFEAVKGVLILGLGFGLLALRHTDVHAVTDSFLSQLGVNPEAHYPRLFVENLAKVGDTGLGWFALLALLSAALRFTEAIGLWFEKHWAEWLTFVAASLYLPFEVHHIFVHPDWFGFAILGVNLAIVAFLGRVLVSQRKEKPKQEGRNANGFRADKTGAA